MKEEEWKISNRGIIRGIWAEIWMRKCMWVVWYPQESEEKSSVVGQGSGTEFRGLPLKRGKPNWACISRKSVSSPSSAVTAVTRVMVVLISIVLYKSKLPQSPTSPPTPHPSPGFSNPPPGPREQHSCQQRDSAIQPITQCLNRHFQQHGRSGSLDPLPTPPSP